MSSRKQQVNTFEKGLNGGIHKEGLPPNFYTDAINIELSEKNGVQAAQNMRGDLIQAMQLDAGEEIIRAFSVIATYGPEKEKRDSIILFVSTNVATEFKIYIFDCTNPIGQRYIIYNDDLRPLKENHLGLDIQPEMDAYHYGDGPDHYLYWTDNYNPPRHIRMHVENPATVDNSEAPLSPLFVPNEPDMLYIQRFWPVDMPEVEEVQQEGGGLRAGAYQFAYRYFNTETKQYSVISLLTNPQPVIQDNTTTTHTNDIQGYGPGSITAKSIVVKIAKSHYHHTYYNAIQLYVVRKTGRDSVEIFELEPSKTYYGTQAADSLITYTGNEPVASVARESVQYGEAEIETAITIEEEDGRLFLGGVKMWDLSLPEETAPVSGSGRTLAETLIQPLDVPVDPITSVIADGKGYYDELNCQKWRGYWRDEVYQFAKIYFNKFGFTNRPKTLEFNSEDRYDPLNHSTTWQKNHADASVFDFKFAGRQSQEGSLFEQGDDQIRPFGLRVSNIQDHPDWAYGVAIVRRKRIKNILGQTPIVHGSATMGVPAPVSSLAMSKLYVDKPSYKNNSLYDYVGKLDTYVPRRLSQGHLRHLLIFPVDSANPWKIYFHGYEYSYDHKTGKTLDDHPRTNLLYTYPLEYLANADGPFQDIPIDGSASVKIIDLVLLKSFNTLRGTDFKTIALNDQQLFNSFARDSYGWAFAPWGRRSYYYMQATPGQLLDGTGTDTDGSVPLAPQYLRIEYGFEQTANGDPIPLDIPVSSIEKLSHLQWIDGLYNLAVDQIDMDILKYQVHNMLPVGPCINQRSLILVTEMGDAEPVAIYDPAEFLLTNYQIGAGNLDTMFDTAANGRPDLYQAGIQQDRAQFDTDSTDFHEFMGVNTIYESYQGEWVMNPGDGLPIWIANIERGLGDDRYGGRDTAGDFVLTGSYRKINDGFIAANTPLQMDVWGGDCYITRLTTQTATNHPARDTAIIEEVDDYQYIGAHGSGAVEDYARTAQKITAPNIHAEIMDLWVESEVNGHYIFRQGGQYPENFRTRDAATSDDVVTNPKYSYPSQSQALAAFYTPQHLYNFGYSAQNEEQEFFSSDIRETVKQKLLSRFHYSNQRVFNASTLGFDQFDPGDLIDLDSQFGPIQRLIKAPGNKMYAIQNDGVAEIVLGQTMTEDAGGVVLNITSGKVVGYVRYISGGLDFGGAIGIQSIKSAAMINNGVFLYDRKRSKIAVIQDGQIQEIGFPAVEKFVEAMKPLDPTNVVTWYDTVNGRMCVMETEGNTGIVFNERLGLWETRLQLGIDLVDACVSNGSVYGVIGTNRGGNTLVYKMYEGADSSTYFGEAAESSVEVPLNVGAIETHARVLYTVALNASAEPLNIQAITQDQLPKELSDPAALTLRRSLYYANPFVKSGTNKRIRSDVVALLVDLTREYRILLSSILSEMRTETRRDETD